MGLHLSSVDFSSGNLRGTLTIEALQNVHPNTINSSETLNRYWKITKDNSLAFTTAAITFNYRRRILTALHSPKQQMKQLWLLVNMIQAIGSFPTISSRLPGGSNDGGSITISGVTSFSDLQLLKLNQLYQLSFHLYAKSEGNYIKLNWRTETEVSNHGFYVERRISEGEWNSIGFVVGSGNSNSPKDYSYSDRDLFAGGSKFQYRLKQIDNDGSFEYSEIVEVEMIPDQYELSQNYPNPFNPGTTIQFSLPKQTQLKINLYNMLGEQVATITEGTYESGYHK